MSSLDDLAPVYELAKKAKELSQKGHLLRAADYYGRVADAARVLGEDNLVLVSARLNKGAMLYSYCLLLITGAAPLGESSHCSAALAESIALISENVASLERRRLAGTLLEGKCTALEEAWFGGELLEHEEGLTSHETLSMVKLVGYEQFLRTATSVAPFFSTALHYHAVSDAQSQQFVRHFVQAVELMQLPRRNTVNPLPHETLLYEALCLAVDQSGPGRLGDLRLTQVLTDAKLRLERSGVLRTRNITARALESTGPQEAYEAAVLHSMSAPDLRSCALASCGVKEAHPQHYKTCAACRGVAYCCKEHQLAHWPSHKAACKEARKAAASGASSGPSGGA